ncbi:MAG: prolyl oligopeptidase family serine peptidase [Acidimicrobiia bacterium]|nr:prolyl oligopeptidase family serine peptidase [Acidimicrobiia bacterium]
MGAKLYEPYHQALLAAGIAVLVFDYRGFGGSAGDASYLDPMAQVEDWRAANSFLETRPEIDSQRIGAFGSGGTGGGNAVCVAALDSRVKAVVSQVPIADGREWLRRMRREHEWLDFLQQVEDDRRQRAATGESRLVSVREEIMVPTPERRTTTVKADVDGRVPTDVQLASAEAIMAYRAARPCRSDRSTRADAHLRGERCDNARGSCRRVVRTRWVTKATRDPDRHDSLCRLR